MADRPSHRFRTVGTAFPWQFVKFAVVGMVNTLVGLSVIFAAKGLLGWGDLAANILGYGVGLSVSFVLNRNWTFRHGGTINFHMVGRFILVFLTAYAVNLLALFGLRDWAGVDSYVAQAASVVSYSVLFYLGSRRFVFPSATRCPCTA